MQDSHFDSAAAAPHDRSSFWNKVIADSYFPLHMLYREPHAFKGKISNWSLGEVSLSRLTTDPLSYRRRRAHIQREMEEEYLVTLPLRAPVQFSQLGRDVRCEPGGLLVERGDEPYVFSHEHPNDLLVMKVDKSILSERLSSPDQYCAQVFDAETGVGGLFSAMLRRIQTNQDSIPLSARPMLGKQLLELLTLVLQENQSAEQSSLSGVRSAHISRIERYVQENLQDPDLSPESVAVACGISKRYLHNLFSDRNCTISQLIRDRRLVAARDRLGQMGEKRTIAEIAYQFGFSDQAQFSRLFRSKFGMTPTRFRADSQPN